MDDRKTQRILIVDDSVDNLQVLMGLLKDDYKIIAATSGEKALELAAHEPAPDLILLDVMMPELDGYEVCRRLKATEKTAGIPVIFVTALGSSDDEYLGFEVGAVDYLTKPVIPKLAKARIKNHLELKTYRDQLNREVARRTSQLQLLQSVMIESLGTLAEYRDPETGGHIKRTQNYVKALATHLQNEERFADQLSDEYIELLYLSAPLHDIGKVGVTDSILLKPGKLTDSEFREMQKHAQFGSDVLCKAEIILGTDSFIRLAKEIALTHQEKWDGSGYPNGLSGESIPLSGRLMALADVYDALISKRVYKPPFTHEKAVQIISGESGSHFDPEIVNAFLTIESTFRNIALKYADFEEEREALGGAIGGNSLTGNLIKHILLVEDNDINLEVMRTQIEHLGFVVATATDGREAMKLFSRASFDLVLTDLDMPVMNGYELVKSIRTQESNTPVVAITASDFDLSREKAKALGFQGYLLKPFDESQLLHLIKKLSATQP